MRDYQTKSNVGALPDTITATRFGSGEFNSIAVELENAVSTSDQTLAAADGTGEVSTQLAMALAIYGAGGAFYHADSGVVNAYVLTPISPKESPPSYFDGFTVIFEPGTPNNTASTVNVATLGVKDITYSDGNPLEGGELSGSCGIKYNLSDDRFELLFSSGAMAGLSASYVVDSTQTDQGAASSNPDSLTIFDVAALVGTSKSATIHLKHNPVAGNVTNFVFDTSLDLSSYPYLKFQIDEGARLTRTTGDEIFTIYSSENLFIGKRQQITSVGMIRFYYAGNIYPNWWGEYPNGSNDTAVLNLAIAASDVTGSLNGYIDATIVSLPGRYAIADDALSTIKCNFIASNALFAVISNSNTETHIFSFDFTEVASYRLVDIGTIFGDNVLVDTGHYNRAIEVIGGDSCRLRVGSLQGLYTGVIFTATNGHIGMWDVEIDTILSCDNAILLDSGTTIDTEVEANRFRIRYLSYCPNAIVLQADSTHYNCSSNVIRIGHMELHAFANEIGFYLTGENVFSNKFIVDGILTPPSGTGDIIQTFDSAHDNLFQLPYIDFAFVTTSGGYNQYDLSGKINTYSPPADLNLPNNFGRSVVMLDAAPSTLAWREGDRVWNNSPSDNIVGWVNTADGTPGTWQKFGQIVLDGSDTWDPPSVAAGSFTQKDVTVTGAVLGDFAIAAFSLSTALLQLDAQVVSANTVSVQLFNPTAGAIDLASGTIYARVFKR